MGYWDFLIVDDSKTLDSTDASIAIILNSAKFDFQGSITRLMFNSAKESGSSIGTFSLDVHNTSLAYAAI